MTAKRKTYKTYSKEFKLEAIRIPHIIRLSYCVLLLQKVVPLELEFTKHRSLLALHFTAEDVRYWILLWRCLS